MRGAYLVLAAVIMAFAAQAADGPKIAPPAAWVMPADVSKLAAAGPPTTAATRSLLFDQQLHFGASGGEIYVESALQAQTAQGLGALGTVALPWQPDTQTLTVHKLHLIRGGQVIDILADHSFTMLRRETNLETATLDGVLTAALQVEGVQVGDVLDLAVTYGYDDPVLKGHANFVLQPPADAPLDTFRLTAAWGKARQVRFKVGDGLPAPKLVKAGDGTELNISIKSLTPEAAPKQAPARFAAARQIEFSDFATWADISSLFAPLYDKAAVLAPNSPLKAEAAKIRAASADPAAEAAAALTLVQDKVRYVFLGMNDGGLAPASADLTWSRRFGDCKGKTVLLLALLRELGLDARPALVSTNFGDGLEARLPNVGLFDHILVRAVIAGKVYWLDGTRVGDDDLAFLRIPPYRWALPLQTGGASLIPLVQTPLAIPDFDVSLRIDASKGVSQPAPAHGEVIIRGDAATGLRLQIANAQPDAVERMLRDYWIKQHDFIEVKSVSATYDKARREEHWIMDGVATMAWDVPAGGGARRYQADNATLGGKADYKRDPGPHADAPYAVPFPVAETYRETILLPDQGRGFSVEGEDIAQTIAGTAFKRMATLKAGVFTMEAAYRTVAPEFPAAEAPAAAEALSAMSEKGLYIREPARYEPTPEEKKAIFASQPKTAQEFTYRGWLLNGEGEHKKAILDFDRAIALDPKYSLAFADRAIAHYDDQDFDAARADAEKADALHPGDDIAAEVEGWLDQRQGRYAEAVANFSRALDKFPDEANYLLDRARAYWSLSQPEKALADTDRMLRVAPKAAAVRLLRAEIYRSLGQADRARAEIDASVAAWPYNVDVLFERARELALEGHRDAAIRDLDVVIAVKPSVRAYLTRAYDREKADRAGRLADIAAALKLDPKDPSALGARADIALETGDAAGSTKLLSDALKAAPDSVGLHAARAVIEAKSGRTDLATADFAWLRSKSAESGDMLNDLCWTESGFDPLLAAALADCEAALKRLPLDAQIIDSHAFVLLRLGRLEAAQAEYDRALALRPHQAASLYGRGLVERRRGLAKQGQADIAAAQRLDARAGEELNDKGARP